MQPLPYRLTERRAKDRETMAREVETLATRMGWDCSRCEYTRPHEIRLNLRGPEGLSVSIEFERHTSMPDHYCLPWHFSHTKGTETKLSQTFGRYQGSEVNPYHGRKCTAFAAGIDTLLDKLQVAMEMANGTSPFGSAFTGELESPRPLGNLTTPNKKIGRSASGLARGTVKGAHGQI